jgi:PTH1 family peptidyl-tRNA hydrolase
VDFLIAGLGNPGEAYKYTPHNLGFLVVDRLAERHSIRVTRKENMAFVGLGEIQGRKVALAQPQTFMNLSGPSIMGLLERYELLPDRLIVVVDELDIPWTSLLIRPRGSAPGHNGMKSIIGSLGTTEFIRVRLGIHPGHKVSGEKFVLSPFKKAQMQEVDEMVDRAAAAVETIIAEGVEKSMTMFNRRAPGLLEEEE